MPIQRSHSRRRRVFLDESVIADVDSVDPGSGDHDEGKKKCARIYADAAKRDGQLKITDLIPKSKIAVACIIAGCAAVILLLNYLAIGSPGWSNFLSREAIGTLSFTGIGTFSSWFSSFLLLMTSMASLLVYSMRRHRNDDYVGAYRIWLWLSVLFVLASVNCVVDFQSVFHSLVTIAGYPPGKNILLLTAIKFFALNLILIRGLFEIHQSRGATVAVILAWIAYTTALAAQYPQVPFGLTQHRDLILGNSTLIGSLASFAMTLIFARFVYRHANELVDAQPLPLKIAGTRQPATTEKIAGSKLQQDPDVSRAGEKRTGTQRTHDTPNQPVPTGPLADEDLECETLSLKDSQDLSKAERRRLRKLQKRQQRRAA